MSKLIKGEKKELTPNQIKIRNILGWISTALCIAMIIASLIISIWAISGSTVDEKGNPKGIGGKANMVVKTNSMEPTIMTNDFIVVELLEQKEVKNLEIGQVITYRRLENSRWIFVTHRISDYIIANDGSRVGYVVVGDNPNLSEEEDVYCNNVVGKWGTPAEKNADGTFNVTKDTKGGNLGQIGVLINYIYENNTNFFLVVILPLIIVFLVYVFILVRSLVIAKIAKTKEETLATATIDGLTEEDKRRLAEEYLAQLARDNASETAPATEDADVSDETPLEDENTDKGDGQA